MSSCGHYVARNDESNDKQRIVEPKLEHKS